MTSQQIIAIVIFLVTMVAVMTEKVHRAVAAMAGAVLMILFHILSLSDCVAHVDVNTLGVLVGMMIFVAVVKKSGIFEYVAIKSAKLAKGKPWRIMVSFVLITAILSAFLDNVTTVLLVGPMTLAITGILKINPIPYMVSEILASNMGGTATLIGDPPNIMIGSAAKLGFSDFLFNTGAPVVVILALTLLCFRFLYVKEMQVDQKSMDKVMNLDENVAIHDKALMIKSLVVMALVVLGFILHSQTGIESGAVALTGAVIILLIGKQDAEDIILSVEWPTILFFIGLFVVVGGLQEVGVINMLAQTMINATQGNMVMSLLIVLWASALISAFLDNIPFVATMIPLILTMGQSGINITPLWWALSLGACLGGNGTLIGASANVVLSSISTKNGYPITFKSFTKIGFPIMLMSVAISTVWLLLRFA
ncbi:MAG: ArsB/NhaD family transporter [Clostridiales bacterium]|jgi:Na+/H+ antiporter NhaD/arsenite permease-like protein|nr:ArsB/NhaD family transporter [Clostridiales bacterium]MCI2160411.1 ArsB/NhaD family transporter [Oscillospiraceae bacterium]MCI1961828.1 ArsB/NhaD family transporter [Clostridiales bacterium]MCI2022439.1 ArsB/NhaD family transporter [Clostridiales bacterium]MCI2026836.1 ArsB/NhaD family transporter [Clostridiales bacterium]